MNAATWIYFASLIASLASIALTLSDALIATLSNRVFARMKNRGEREHRHQFQLWITLPLFGLVIGMTPTIVEWVNDRYGLVYGLNAFMLCALGVIFSGFLFGVVKWGSDERSFVGFRSCEALYVTLIERTQFGPLSSEELADARDSLDVCRNNLAERPRLSAQIGARLTEGVPQHEATVRSLVPPLLDLSTLSLNRHHWKISRLPFLSLGLLLAGASFAVVVILTDDMGPTFMTLVSLISLLATITWIYSCRRSAVGNAAYAAQRYAEEREYCNKVRRILGELAGDV